METPFLQARLSSGIIENCPSDIRLYMSAEWLQCVDVNVRSFKIGYHKIPFYTARNGFNDRMTACFLLKTIASFAREKIWFEFFI